VIIRVQLASCHRGLPPASSLAAPGDQTSLASCCSACHSGFGKLTGKSAGPTGRLEFTLVQRRRSISWRGLIVRLLLEFAIWCAPRPFLITRARAQPLKEYVLSPMAKCCSEVGSGHPSTISRTSILAHLSEFGPVAQWLTLRVGVRCLGLSV